jgi:hypothetical protein
MRTPLRITNRIMLRATALRTISTRAAAIDALRGRRRPSPHPSEAPATITSTIRPLEFSSNQGVFGRDCFSHWDTAAHNTPPWSLDKRARSMHTTHISHDQADPGARQPTTQSPAQHVAAGPATGAGTGAGTGASTGVPIAAQMFGADIKGNPTESEADVAADRCDVDPLPPELHHTIRMGAGGAAPRPTESEEDVVADRLGGADGDPLGQMRGAVGKGGVTA